MDQFPGAFQSSINWTSEQIQKKWSGQSLLLPELREGYCWETALMGRARVWIGDSVFNMELACTEYSSCLASSSP
jgi:hypothetical protein